MKRIARMVPVVFVAVVLTVAFACAKRQPVSHFVIVPAPGRAEIIEPEIERLKVVLDEFGAQYHMKKLKSGQAGIIRYYQPNANYEIGFFAKRTPTALMVYAEPMTPSVEGSEPYQTFRQNLANVLSQNFPGRITLEKPKGE